MYASLISTQHFLGWCFTPQASKYTYFSPLGDRNALAEIYCNHQEHGSGMWSW